VDTRAVLGWLGVSALGVVLGWVSVWFWLAGGIIRTSEWRLGRPTFWMMLVLPKEKYSPLLYDPIFEQRVLRVISVISLVAFWTLFEWLILRSDWTSGDTLRILAMEASIPLFMPITWGLVAWRFHRFARRSEERLRKDNLPK